MQGPWYVSRECDVHDSKLLQVVTAAGNNNGIAGNAIQNIPPIWNPSLPIVVVGGTDVFGARLDFSQWTNALYPNAKVSPLPPG